MVTSIMYITMKIIWQIMSKINSNVQLEERGDGKNKDA